MKKIEIIDDSISKQQFLLLHGDSKNVLKDFPDNFVHTVVTSPPYWQLRDYFAKDQLGQESTPEEYVENLVNICREIKRVLRKDGTFWLNIGDSYNNSSGFERAKDKWKREGRKGGSSDKTSFKHKTIKVKDLVGMPWKVAFALQEDGWYLRCDIIWCLSGGAEVYIKTDNREFSISIKELYRLNPCKIKLWNGEKWTQMLKMSRNPQQHNEIQLTLRSGERICCTPNHKWPTKKGVIETKDLKVGDILKKCVLPEPSSSYAIEHIPDNEIGWFIGIYLAEGSRSGKTIQIASHKKEIKRFEKLRDIAGKYHGTAHKYNTSDNGMTINIHSNILNAIIDMYIGGRAAKDKYLSSLCWQRNNIFLKNILDGYLEGDGHFDKKNNRYRIEFTRNYFLENSLRTICARLNIFCTIKLAHSKIGKKIYKTFKGEIRFEKSTHKNCKDSLEIIKIETDKGGREYFYDIEVEDEPNLFALSSGVLTHNSKTNPMPDGAKDRPTRGHEYIFLLTKSSKYYYDYYGVLENTDKKPEQIQGFGAKEQQGTYRMDQNRTFEHYGKRNKRSVWETSVSTFKGKHFATFSPQLIDPCVKASISEKGCCVKCGSPWIREFEKKEIKSEEIKTGESVLTTDGEYIADKTTKNKKGYDLMLVEKGWKKGCDCDTDEVKPCIVLDPFNGSGTTGKVALKYNQNYIGIDTNEEYLKIARRNICGNKDDTENAYHIYEPKTLESFLND